MHIIVKLLPLRFMLDVYRSRYQIYQMAKRDFVSTYVDSYLGLFWAFFRPMIMLSMMWFVFAFGFRVSNSSSGVPYIAYLFTGLISWNFLSEMFGSGARVIQQHSFLVNKVDFKLFILPVVTLLPALIMHIFFIMMLIVVLCFNEIYPNFYWFQIFYYLFGACLLLIGLSWITSSISLFVPDINQIIPVIVQIGFWATPVFWEIERIPPSLQIYLKLNPFFYIVQGYREALIYNVGFWKHPINGVYFWGFTVTVLLTGMIVYKRLKPHFAEVV